MPAPTALQRAPEALAIEESTHDATQSAVDEDDFMISTSTAPEEASASDAAAAAVLQPTDSDMQVDEESRPIFKQETLLQQQHRSETRKVLVPPHRFTPLKNAWPKIYPPLVEHLKLQVRMNPVKKAVELRTSKHTEFSESLQKGADFISAFCLGFDVDDAIALLRMDDLYIQSFTVNDVKTLSGDHLSRAIGRVAGQGGKTKFAIENASKTRIVVADQKIHVMGAFQNIHIATTAISSLILGSPPSKVYGNLRTVASRMKERF